MKIAGTVYAVKRDDEKKMITVVIETAESTPQYYPCTEFLREANEKPWYNSLKRGDTVFAEINLVGRKWTNTETGEEMYFIGMKIRGLALVKMDGTSQEGGNNG